LTTSTRFVHNAPRAQESVRERSARESVATVEIDSHRVGDAVFHHADLPRVPLSASVRSPIASGTVARFDDAIRARA
jgi:hypothetical protein